MRGVHNCYTQVATVMASLSWLSDWELKHHPSNPHLADPGGNTLCVYLPFVGND